MKRRSYIVIILLFLFNFLVNAQEKVTQFYDLAWTKVPVETAIYRAEFIKEGKVYRCTLYTLQTGAKYMESTFADTVLQTPLEKQIHYYENGNTKDSTVLNDKGEEIVVYAYYPDKKLKGVGRPKPGTPGEFEGEGYDKNGKKIDGFIFYRDASFKGGDADWKKYLGKNMNTDLWGLPDGEINVVVHIKFRINKRGSVDQVSVHKSSGIKPIDADAKRVIMESPLWNPRLFLNEPTEAYRIQPMTYQIVSKKKNKKN
jgi:hypothetical protein